MTDSSLLSTTPAELRLDTQNSLDDQLVDIEARLRSLDEQQAEYEARQADFADLQAQWNAQHAQLRQQCEDRAKELDRIKAALDASRSQLDEERQLWETTRDDRNADRAAGLELSAARQAFEEQKAAWESQRSVAQQNLEERLAGLDALRVDLESQRAAWEKQRQKWEAQRDETAVAQAEEGRRLAARQAEIDAQLRSPEACEATVESEQSDRPQLDGQQAQTETSTAATSTAAAETISEAPSPADDAELSEAAAPRDASEATEAAVVPMAAESPAPPSIAAPVSLAEVLRRTGFQVELDDEPPESCGSKEAAGATSAVSAASSVSITAPVARTRKPAHSSEDDVSIDDYMARLLARNRGDGVEAPAAPSKARPSANPPRTQAAPPVAAPAKPAAAPVSPAPAPRPAVAAAPVEMTLRPAAPEKMDLRAMRQLANFSANTALNRHESKQLTGTTRTKLAITLVASTVGAALIGLYLTGRAPAVTLALAVASFSVAGLWGTNYVTLCKRMMGVRMAHMERHLKAGEETAAAETVATATVADTTSAEAAKTDGEKI